MPVAAPFPATVDAASDGRTGTTVGPAPARGPADPTVDFAQVLSRTPDARPPADKARAAPASSPRTKAAAADAGRRLAASPAPAPLSSSWLTPAAAPNPPGAPTPLPPPALVAPVPVPPGTDAAPADDADAILEGTAGVGAPVASDPLPLAAAADLPLPAPPSFSPSRYARTAASRSVAESAVPPAGAAAATTDPAEEDATIATAGPVTTGSASDLTAVEPTAAPAMPSAAPRPTSSAGVRSGRATAPAGRGPVPVISAAEASGAASPGVASAAADAEPVLAPDVDPSIRLVAPVENFAAGPQPRTAEIPTMDSAGLKKSLKSDGQEDTKYDSAVGTDSAKALPNMTASAFSHPAALGAFLNEGVPATARSASAAGAATPLPETTAHAAVAAVVKVIQAQTSQAQGSVSSVNLSFNFGSDDLSVRVAWHAGVVQTQFRTDSADLRSAIASEWQAMSAAPAGRTLPLAAPVFASTGDSLSSSPDDSGASGRPDYSGDQDAPDFGPTSGPLVPAGPTPRRPAPTHAAGLLHAFA